MTKLSGGLNNWYVVQVKNPQRKEQEPYQAECEDIIQALGMTFDEGCAFKAQPSMKVVPLKLYGEMLLPVWVMVNLEIPQCMTVRS